MPVIAAVIASLLIAAHSAVLHGARFVRNEQYIRTLVDRRTLQGQGHLRILIDVGSRVRRVCDPVCVLVDGDLALLRKAGEVRRVLGIILDRFITRGARAALRRARTGTGAASGGVRRDVDVERLGLSPIQRDVAPAGERCAVERHARNGVAVLRRDGRCTRLPVAAAEPSLAIGELFACAFGRGAVDKDLDIETAVRAVRIILCRHVHIVAERFRRRREHIGRQKRRDHADGEEHAREPLE